MSSRVLCAHDWPCGECPECESEAAREAEIHYLERAVIEAAKHWARQKSRVRFDFSEDAELNESVRALLAAEKEEAGK